MKKLFIATLFLLTAIGPAALAAPVSDDLIKSLVRCSGPSTIQRQPLSWKMPAGVSAQVITIGSESAYCAAQYAAVTFPSGRFYLGTPWPLSDVAGSREEKLKKFAWERLRSTVSATIDTKTKPVDGFSKVRVTQKTEFGDLVTDGWIDGAGLIYLPGEIYAPGTDVAKARTQRLQNALASSPSAGTLTAAVTLVEFSDFQCPSCRNASAFMKPILAKYGSKIRYVRVDYPLMQAHPWAFPAALSGRAIYKQNPAAFWKFKEWVYDNQAELSNFTLEDFARNFVKDNGLNVAQYDKDMASPELRKQIFAGMAAGNAVDVSGTPTFLVNGVAIDPGRDGSAMQRFIAQKLGAK